MKKKTYLILGLAVMTSLFTACSSDEVVSNDNTPTAKKQVTLSASLAGAGTRVELSDLGVGNGLKETWSTSDNILVKNGTDLTAAASTLTRTTTTADAQTDNFTGDLAVSNGQQLYAYYPSTLTLADGSATATVDYSTQGGTLATVQKQAVMAAAATYNETGKTAFNFQNTTTVLRVAIVLPVTTTVSKLTLSGAALINKADMTPAADGTVTWSNQQKGDITVTFATPLSVTAGTVAYAYVAMIPQTSANSIAVTATADYGVNYSFIIPANATFASSKVQNVDKANTAWTISYYEWDAISPYPTDGTTPSEGSDSYCNYTINGTTSYPPTEKEGASKLYPTQNAEFNKCPTFNEITWYLAGGAYYDANQRWGAGENEKGGLWLKKKAKIISDGTTGTGTTAVTAETFTSSKSSIYKIDATTNSSLWLTTAPDDLYNNWFFLPAAGDYSSGLFKHIGTDGYYWSSTPLKADNTFSLEFNSSYARVYYKNREHGFCLWSAQ
jgi:hypothetical protein